MTTDPAPLSARLRDMRTLLDAAPVRYSGTASDVCDRAADALDALSARVAELETFRGDAYDTLLAIGLALGLPDPTAPDAPEEAPAAWHGKLSKKVAAVVCRATQAEAEREKEERAHIRTIDQRDDAEKALSDMFSAVTGRGPEWSNNFGYPEAIEEVEATIAELVRAASEGGAALSASQAREAGMREALTAARGRIVTLSKKADLIVADHRDTQEVLAAIDAALSPAQPSQGADIARELAELIAIPHTEPGWMTKRNALLAKARSAGLLTTETTEGGNG